MDENPYQSPQSEDQPLPERQRGRAPLIVRAFLSEWTGLAIAGLLLASVLSGTSSTDSFIRFVFVGLGLALFWFAAHGIAALVWR